ncbi:MAG: hypothetical protein ACOYNF_08835 [Rhodoferax sp.]
MQAFGRAKTALAVLTLAVFTGLSLWHGGRAAWSNVTTLQSRWLITQWRYGTGPVFDEQRWQDARSNLLSALQYTPGNPLLLEDLGFLDGWRAYLLGTPEVGSQEYMRKHDLLASAITSYRDATRLRPTYPHVWANLAVVKHRRGEHDAELWLAFDKALHYGPTESGVQIALAQVAFPHWATLDPERRRQCLAMWASATQATRTRLKFLANINLITVPGL